MSSCWRRDSAVLTTMSRSVRDWNVPPRPMSSTSPSIERASSRMTSSAACARSRWCCSSATSRSWLTQPPPPFARTDESTGPRHAPSQVPAAAVGPGCIGGPSYDAAVSVRLAESPFLRACRSQPVEHVPVWFMRQAGRSLPEYRALRGTGSILDAIGDPALACEVTLQPVRRYGVDAAILFSDIIVPLHAIGFGVDVVPGRARSIEHPVRAAGGPRAAPRARGRRRRPRDRDRPSRDEGALGERHAPHRLRRRAVHGRELRRRGRPDEDLRGGEVPRPRRPGALRRR